ncbi:putative glycosyltransferase EpsJ [Rubripirellula lacrimiformis]|uniref:Putative glycosyltransferase EpsJ n=1 Tax=Rubripirellula lacrimiformis TaxID=1930273 RepID=A0A517NJJ9_9BACT|nr:glycosyltransferase family A protein [Rubripirellula lacrimiformis]QDT07300.1 putative glycosyltransferase EpsJ [Rubripirellula lacrimiformis]
MTGTVTVLIPAYNAESFLAEAIRSCLEQTRQPNQIIVVDDGSTDRTAEVAESFADSVTLIRQPNNGAAAARNAGIAIATGDYIALLDADDLMTPDRIELQIRLIGARPELDLVFGQQLVFQDGENPVQLHRDGTGQVKPDCVASSVFCRRDVFRNVGLFCTEHSVGEMIEWFARAQDLGIRSDSVDQTVLYRRQHANNSSTQNRSDYVHVLKSILDRRRAK